MHVSTALFIDMAHAKNAQGLSSVFAPTHIQLKFERNMSRFRIDELSNGFVHVLLIEQIMIEKFTVEP